MERFYREIVFGDQFRRTLQTCFSLEIVNPTLLGSLLWADLKPGPGDSNFLAVY